MRKNYIFRHLTALKVPRFMAFLMDHMELIQQLTYREIASRYRGSALGWAWSLITPLMMLAVYTLVFSSIFQTRWAGSPATQNTLTTALNIFAGMITFGMLSEAAGQAPAAILSKPNYVTKIVFPLEALPVAIVASALFHACTSAIILIGSIQFLGQGLPVTSLWLPLVWLPMVLICLASCWCLSALGVFLRDLGQIVGVALSMLMFLSTVFYPLEALPSSLRPLLSLNPLIEVIHQTREVLLNGNSPSPIYLAVGTGMGILACELSFRGFTRARRGFADVI